MNTIDLGKTAANTPFAARLGDALAWSSVNILTSGRGRDLFQMNNYLNFNSGELMGMTLGARPAP